MKRIKPSQGLMERPAARIIIEGKFAGPVIWSDNLGGRWTIEIRDLGDQGASNPPAFLSINLEPKDNPHLPAGIPDLRMGVRSLFESQEFSPLFREGAPFLAEAVLGLVDGRPWFNVSEWLLVEPDYPVGVRQIIGEPICERRIMLAARGIKSRRNANYEDANGGFIVGDLVHSVFQAIATALDRETRIKQAQQNPALIVAEFLPREVALKASLLMIGISPRITGSSEIATAVAHIKNLVSSPAVLQLLGVDQWHSEVRAANPAIDGIIDIRSTRTILELKTDAKQRTAHIEQAQLYLVADMLKHGVREVCQQHKAFVVRSSTQIPDDNLRVTPAHRNEEMLLQMLDRFVTARHRFLLAGGRLILPKIKLSEAQCEDCPFFKDDSEASKPSPCHFYCQTDRNWLCDGCNHATPCSQSQMRHSYAVLDDSNRIRVALIEEIQALRRESIGGDARVDWERTFRIEQIRLGGQFVLAPQFSDDVDPPLPGSEVFIEPDGWSERIPAEVIQNGFVEDSWIIATNAPLSTLATGLTCRVFQSRSRVAAAYSLLSCVDELQRESGGSSKEGISFAGGSALSGKLQAVDSIQKGIEAGAQDIFCQCFNIHESRSLLRGYVETNPTGSILIVTDAPDLGLNNDTILKLDASTIQSAITGVTDARDALKNLKAELDTHRVWVISSQRLLSGCLSFLPSKGLGYFEHLILFEAAAISPLDYFTIRSMGKRRICMGDANAIGRKMTSPLAQGIGLGNSLIQRVLQKGFPIPNMAVVVNTPKQSLPAGISRALAKCKLELAVEPTERCAVKLEPHDFRPEVVPAVFHYVDHFVDVPNSPSREIRVRPEGVPSDEHLRDDLKSFQLNLALMPQDRLTATVSGNIYTVLNPPAPTVRALPGTWLVRVERSNGLPTATNNEEAAMAVELARRFLSAGMKPKNLVILSPFASQLQKIAESLGEVGKGVAFRTPYNICGEQWGTAIISCAVDSLVDSDQDLANPRLFYTMFRACITNVHVFGHREFINNHPLLRNIESQNEHVRS
jgi:hypothetical protein